MGEMNGNMNKNGGFLDYLLRGVCYSSMAFSNAFLARRHWTDT